MTGSWRRRTRAKPSTVDEQRGQQQRADEQADRPRREHLAQRDDVAVRRRARAPGPSSSATSDAQRRAAEGLAGGSRRPARPAVGGRSPLDRQERRGQAARRRAAPARPTVTGEGEPRPLGDVPGPPALVAASWRTASAIVRCRRSGPICDAVGPGRHDRPARRRLPRSPRTSTASIGLPLRRCTRSRAPAAPPLPPLVETNVTVRRRRPPRDDRARARASPRCPRARPRPRARRRRGGRPRRARARADPTWRARTVVRRALAVDRLPLEASGVETSYAAPIPRKLSRDPARERGVGGVARAAPRIGGDERPRARGSRRLRRRRRARASCPSGAGWSCSENAQTISASRTGTSAAR